ncbi:DNA recombination protein RmuC [Paracoccus laeviglucosivorans]|uniref:DNA recombination protein RmuC homolog n=1 Tax=Paracoccus laeviglucosivorans TaxID=1197861 RepID=A0A521C5V0_9RHOB|nr:DNA recombination protein RmuC [Paracoccus laeviglucosivorans]SMO54809.1 DNA recombination protein RmuC [Paracoccus laeviglucosivorans]
MPQDVTGKIQAWLGDAGNLQLLAGLLALALALCLVSLWRTRRSQELARGDHAGREADWRAQLEGESHKLRDQLLAVSRLETRAESITQRMQELLEERDGLTDALHRERQSLSTTQRQLAETRLAAEKDREAAERDIATLRELREEMTGHFRLMANETLKSQGVEMQKAHGDQLHALLNPFREQVNRFQTELQARNKATDEERARLKEQIEYLHKRSEQISQEAVALTRALKGDSQKRGAWGEMILERILEDSGLISGTHYLTQTSHRDGDGKLWRPDVIVKMPQRKLLVIDSKVSLNAYEEAVNLEDGVLREAALRRHVQSVRGHVQQLAAKGYQALDEGSVDYVLMFIPVEGAFSEALRVDPDLARFAMENRVGLATPTTLMLTLRTVDHIWTVERRESNAMQIASRAGQLYDKLHGFVSSIEDVGVALDKAQKSHATAMDRLTRGSGNVIRQAEMLRELGARTQKSLALDHDADSLPPPSEAAE